MINLTAECTPVDPCTSAAEVRVCVYAVDDRGCAWNVDAVKSKRVSISGSIVATDGLCMVYRKHEVMNMIAN